MLQLIHIFLVIYYHRRNMRIEIEISEIDVIVLNNDLLDIQGWVTTAVVGKVASCKKRMLVEWIPRLMADLNVETIPADKEDLIKLIVSRSDYKSRVDKELVDNLITE